MLNYAGGLIPHDGSLPFNSSVRSQKPPSCLESERASITARDSVNTSHCGSGVGGVSLRGQRVPKRSRGLIPQGGYLPFELYMSSPNPPSCLESARASLTARNIPSASTSHHISGGGELSPSGHQVLDQSGGLFPQDGSLLFEPSVKSPKSPYFSESTRASLTASNTARSNNSHGGSGGGGVSLSGQRVHERSGGLFTQDGSLPFELSVTSPKPPS